MERKLLFLFLIFLIGILNAQPNREWVSNYATNYVNHWHNFADCHVTTDNLGNIYVAANNQNWIPIPGVYEEEIVLLKYNPQGQLLWSVRENNGIVYGLAVDINGNVYVTGSSYTPDTTISYINYNIITIKYNTFATREWVAYYDNGSLQGNAITVDLEGNVYVTGSGSLPSSPSSNCITLKYDSVGSQKWVKTISGIGNAISVDNSGGVYVVGGFTNATNDDLMIVKYDANNGDQLTVLSYNGPGNGLDRAIDMKIDNEGILHILGTSLGNGTSFDFVTIKIDIRTLPFQVYWIKRYDSNSNWDNPAALSLDSEGNVFVSGRTLQTGGLESGIVLLKYNPGGQEQWVRVKTIDPGEENRAYSVANDNAGNVYVSGASRSPGASYSKFVIIKYNSAGDEEWTDIYIDSSSLESSGIAFNATAGMDGGIVVTGSVLISNASNFYRDIVTIKYSQDNNNEPPINLTYELETHSLKWNKSPSANVINQLVFKQEYDPWTQTAGPWLSVADSGGLLTTDKSEWVIRTSGFYNFKIGAIFESDTLYTDSIFVNIGYRLRKIENSEVIAYNIETDAFKLINNSDNWPQAWWSQFNYSNPLLYLPVLPFNRKPDSTYVDWHLFADIIGDDQAYLSTTLNYARLFPAILWGRITGPFKGACAGFSITSLLGFYKNPEYLSQFPYMVNKEPGSIPKTDDNARKVINHLQNTQSFKYPSELVYEPADSINRTPNYLLQRLMEIFSDYENTELDQYISLYTGSGLHAVLPIAVSKNDFVPNRYDIYVYDSNHPNEYNFILIFNEENTWLFPDFLTDMSTGIALEGPLTSRLGILSIDPDYTAPENPSAKYSDKLLTSTTGTVYTSGSSSVSVLVDNETLAGYDIVNNIPVSFDNSIIEATDGILRAPKGYYIPIGETSVSFSDQIEGSSAHLMFQSLSGNYYLAERSDGAGLNETEVLELNEEGFSYLNNDNVNKTISLTSVFEDSSQSKLAKISGLGIGMNEVISLSLEEDEVNLKNIGEAKTYSIDLLYATAEEQLEFYNSSVSITTNTTHYIQPDWNHIDSSSLTILIDLGSDGTIDDTLVVYSQSISINAKVYLQGPYSSGLMSTVLKDQNQIPTAQPYNVEPWLYEGTENVSQIPEGVVDWVLLELRENETTSSYKRAAFLRSDGKLVDLDGISNVSFTDAVSAEYYLVITHRNHLPVMTNEKIILSAIPELFDLTNDTTKVFGSNSMADLGEGILGLFAGDTDGNGTVNAADRSNAWNQRNLSGYYGTDVDLSGTVNAADRSVIWNNRNISIQVPAATDKSSTTKMSGDN